MKGRKATAEEKIYMSKVARLGCIVCAHQGKDNRRVEIHHVNGKTKKDAHFQILPLCYEHHRKGDRKEPISRHPWKKRFIEAYGTEEELMKQVRTKVEYEDFLEELNDCPF